MKISHVGRKRNVQVLLEMRIIRIDLILRSHRHKKAGWLGSARVSLLKSYRVNAHKSEPCRAELNWLTFP